MLTLFTGLVLALVAQDDAAKDPAKDFKALCQQLMKAESYSFQVVQKDEGGMSGMRMGRGGREGAQGGTTEPTKVAGKYQKGKPFHIKSGKLEAYRLEDATVYKEGEGKWQLYDRQAMMRGFQRRGGQGGERAERGGRGEGGERGERGGRGGEEGERGERGGADQFANMRAVMSLGRVTLPHETIKKVFEKVKDIKCEEKDKKVVFNCTLTKEGADALSTSSRFGRMRGGRGGEGGPTFENSGTIQLIATAEGKIEKIEINTQMKGSFRDQDFERKSAITIVLSELGKIKLEVPEEALSKFVL
jgi:hypothetical protein